MVSEPIWSSSAWFRFIVHHHLHHITFWFIFCFLESSLISSIWARIVSFLSFISPIQVDITDSQLNLPDSSYFRIVLYPFELRFLPIASSCFRSVVIVLPYPIDWRSIVFLHRRSSLRVHCAAEFVLRWSSAALFRCLRLCAIPIRVDRVSFGQCWSYLRLRSAWFAFVRLIPIRVDRVFFWIRVRLWFLFSFLVKLDSLAVTFSACWSTDLFLQGDSSSFHIVFDVSISVWFNGFCLSSNTGSNLFFS